MSFTAGDSSAASTAGGALDIIGGGGNEQGHVLIDGGSGSGATGSVYYGQSLLDRLTSYITTTLNNTASGSVENRISTLNNELTEQSNLLNELDTRFESTRSRYMQQFSAMESAVTSLKSTGEYLTNLFEAMNNDD